MTPRDILLAASVPAIWGLGFTVAKIGLDQFPPLLLMSLRFAITALILVWFVARPPLPILVKLFGITIIAATLQYGLTFNGLKDLDASTAIILIQLESPFAVLLGALLLKDRVGWRRAGGIALAFGGILLIAGEPRLQDNYLAVFRVISGALVWALGQVLVKMLGQVGGFSLIAWMAVFAAPQMLLASLLFESGQVAAIREADALGWGTILYLGTIMTAVGYGIWYHMLGRHPVSLVAPFLLLLPVTTVLSGVLLLGESLTPLLLLGGLIVVGGVAVIVIEPRRLRRPVLEET